MWTGRVTTILVVTLISFLAVERQEKTDLYFLTTYIAYINYTNSILILDTHTHTNPNHRMMLLYPYIILVAVKSFKPKILPVCP